MLEKNTNYPYTDFEEAERETIIANASRIRDWAERITLYMSGEADYNEAHLQDFRQDSGDIGDEVFEIKMLLNKWIYG